MAPKRDGKIEQRMKEWPDQALQELDGQLNNWIANKENQNIS